MCVDLLHFFVLFWLFSSYALKWAAHTLLWGQFVYVPFRMGYSFDTQHKHARYARVCKCVCVFVCGSVYQFDFLSLIMLFARCVCVFFYNKKGNISLKDPIKETKGKWELANCVCVWVYALLSHCSNDMNIVRRCFYIVSPNFHPIVRFRYLQAMNYQS